eukprot:g5377.t1
MPSFGDSGVSWECVAREFRAKYTGDPGSSASLKAAQAAIEKVLPEVKKIDGLKEVKRAVCGDCGDVKLVVSVEDAKFGAWADMRGSGGDPEEPLRKITLKTLAYLPPRPAIAEAQFNPVEKTLLAEWKKIEGLSHIETQNYTFASL